tara:strand:+ start:726 stop:1727 length:1002 start_codon:yes stop_codon:yes gene_type:complete
LEFSKFILKKVDNMTKIINLLKSPYTNENLTVINNELVSTNGKEKFEIENNIFKFVSKENIELKTKNVRKFYLDYSFPNYNDFDDLEHFVTKMSNNTFIKDLMKLIKPTDTVLEFGCDTGQLGNFLAATGYSKIVSADLSINSLRLANDFKNKNNIKGIDFVETNVFENCFKDEIFDIIISNGVLHHTIDPYLAFQKLLKLLKKDGVIIIGLYNKISRLKNSAIKYLAKVFGNGAIRLFDNVYKSKNGAAAEAWKMDQYFHPLEKRYTFGDIHQWFVKNNIEFVNSLPSYNDQVDLFQKITKIGDPIDRFNLQFKDLIENDEGGLFVFIGKKI